MGQSKLEQLQEKLKENIDKAVEVTEKNTKRNNEGKVVISEDEIKDDDELCTLVESLTESLKEVKLIREGEIPKKYY